MKKKMLFLVVLCASTYAHAFSGTLTLNQTEGALKRTLILSKWRVDKRGVPSFDYRYSQSGPQCDYDRTGHAVAGFEDNGDQVELQIYRGQDEHGKEGPAITIFYDHDDDVVFTLPTSEKSTHIEVSFDDALMKKKFPGRCGFSTKKTGAIFKN